MRIKVGFTENNEFLPTTFSEEEKQLPIEFEEVQKVGGNNGGNCNFTTDETLSFVNNVLSVNVATEPDPDNTLPISSAAVATTVGNIEILLQTI